MYAPKLILFAILTLSVVKNFAGCKNPAKEVAPTVVTTIQTHDNLYDSSLNSQGISVPMGDGLLPGPSYNLKNLLFLYQKEKNNY